MSINIQGFQSAGASAYSIASSTTSAAPFDSLLTGPLANLDLTTDQQTQIQQLLSQNSSSGTQTPTQLFESVENILTPQQQATLKSDLESGGAHHGHHHHHGSGAAPADAASAAQSAYTANGSAVPDASAATLDTNA